MTKKEQAALDAVKKELALERAMRYSGPVEPDVPAPGYNDPVALGWAVVSCYGSYRAEKAACNSVFHRIGADAWAECRRGTGWSQRTMRLFSTKILALQSARHQTWLEAQAALARIDAEIEKEPSI